MTLLSPAQRRALEWLPSDGGWREVTAFMDDPDIDDALDSLWLEEPEYVNFEMVPYTNGRVWRFCLTPAGIALKAEMEADRG